MGPVRWFSVAALSIFLSSSVDAEVILTLSDGRASLHATNATTAEILSAWARTGHTTIVNLDKLDGDRVSLTLEDVSERMALDVILRSAAGFVAIPRTTESPGASRIARIVILPRTTSSADRSRQAASAPPLVEVQENDNDQPPTLTEPAGVEQLFGPDGQPVPDDQADLDPSTQPPAADEVQPAPADELRPDGAVIPAQPR
jgi:hypothetical protein